MKIKKWFDLLVLILWNSYLLIYIPFLYISFTESCTKSTNGEGQDQNRGSKLVLPWEVIVVLHVNINHDVFKAFMIFCMCN